MRRRYIILFLFLVLPVALSGCVGEILYGILSQKCKMSSWFYAEINGEVFSSDTDEYVMPYCPYTLTIEKQKFRFEARKSIVSESGDTIEFLFILNESSEFNIDKKYYFNSNQEAGLESKAKAWLYDKKNKSYQEYRADSGWIEFTSFSYEDYYADGKFELLMSSDSGEKLIVNNGCFTHIFCI